MMRASSRVSVTSGAGRGGAATSRRILATSDSRTIYRFRPVGYRAGVGLIPVVEDAGGQREERAEHGNPDGEPEKPPDRPDRQREPSGQERGHDDAHGRPGDRAAVE